MNYLPYTTLTLFPVCAMKTVLLLGLCLLVSGNQENQECEVDGPDMVKSMLYDWLDLTKTWTEGYKYFVGKIKNQTESTN